MSEPVSYPEVKMVDPSTLPNAGGEAGSAAEESEEGKHAHGVQVTDLSAQATEQNLREFFQFSGKIVDVQLSMPPEGGHQAKIWFEKAEEAETAVLLTGAIILDQQVVISNLFAGAPPPVMGKQAVDVMSLMLSKGYIFGKGTYDKLSDFDKRIGLSEGVKQKIGAAKAKLAELDGKIQFRTRAKSLLKTVEGKLNEVDTKFKISEKFETTSKQVQSNNTVRKVSTGFKYGFSTLSANISKVSNATSSKIKQQINSKSNPPSS